ncbi:MAG: sugar phosphate isomerase/epimerase family protein [Opitutales bacterium]
MSDQPPAKPRLSQFAALWSLQEYPSKRAEWSLERKFAEVAKAGYVGIFTMAEPEVHGPLLEKHGMRLLSLFNIQTKTQIRPQVRKQAEAGAEKIVVHLAKPKTPVEKAAALMARIVDEGAKFDIPVFLETHRATCTENPAHFLALADAFRKLTGVDLPVNWDHSHLAVVQHLNADAWDSVLLMPRTLHQVSPMAHLRPFTAHHAQIPTTDGNGKNSPEFSEWLDFCERYFRIWLEGPRPGNELCVVPELGPKCSGYPMQHFPDLWQDVLACQKGIEKCWKRVLRTTI